ncbi:MAG: hypothetical protein NT106_03215 [Candidatus Sumerlaeota bacterium]|nr:hypothetical protein [Candidatus Sumerlaeota bacterium]
MSAPTISITEIPNALTMDIDLASPKGIVQILRQTDAQIFNGWETYDGLCDTEVLGRLRHAVDETAAVLSHKGKRKIVISGAGTSGRLAMFAARTFNRLAAQTGLEQCFHYLIAGGDLALIKAKEGAEDDPVTAQKDLAAITDDADRVLYIGVTCGFSAPYIAGQLDYAADRENFFSILMGFNPPELARKIKIENWDKRFFDVVEKIKNHPRCILLNPVIGPEPITGSTRMKGGSATKLLLEVLFTAAMVKARILSPNYLTYPLKADAWDIDSLIFAMIRQYEETRISTYAQRDNIARLVELGGTALRAGRHIYYIGRDPYGILGTIDASECPPTFGDAFDDVHGYLPGGWEELLNSQKDYSTAGKEYQISLDHFIIEKLPHLASEDLVIMLGKEETLGAHEVLLEKIKAMDAKIGAVLINPVYNTFPGFDAVVRLYLDPTGLVISNESLAEYSTKLILNAITTGAHILAGKVYQNRMVDLNISNTKLFHRTIGIIKDIVKVDEEEAFKSLMKSIYKTDSPTEEQMKAPVSAHVNAATWKKKITPKALLIATGKFTYEQACAALEKEQIVRVLIQKISQGASIG